jgi:hypothetical protein
MGIAERKTSSGEHIVEFINHARAAVAIEALDAYLFDPFADSSNSTRLKLSLL